MRLWKWFKGLFVTDQGKCWSCQTPWKTFAFRCPACRAPTFPAPDYAAASMSPEETEAILRALKGSKPGPWVTMSTTPTFVFGGLALPPAFKVAGPPVLVVAAHCSPNGRWFLDLARPHEPSAVFDSMLVDAAVGSAFARLLHRGAGVEGRA